MEELAKNLKDIAKIRREIKGLELMIHSNRKTMATDVVSGSSDEFPYSVRHFRIEGVDQSKESALQVKLRHKKKKLERELLKVEKYLDQIEDPEIVRLRDELGMSWNDVAAKCGSTIAAVKMKHKRFLDKIF